MNINKLEKEEQKLIERNNKNKYINYLEQLSIQEKEINKKYDDLLNNCDNILNGIIEL